MTQVFSIRLYLRPVILSMSKQYRLYCEKYNSRKSLSLDRYMYTNLQYIILKTKTCTAWLDECTAGWLLYILPLQYTV